MSNIENPKCKHDNCNRIANYRKLKVGNCHLKNTNYEYCGYHRPINSINKKFPYNSIFDKINIELKYYNHKNDHIIHEYNDYIHKLLKNHRFGFPIKITVFTENLVYEANHLLSPVDVNITNITNYKNYFDKDAVSQIDIFNVIKDFQKYYNDKKIEMLYIHLVKEHDTYDIIREYRNYYEEKIIDNIIKNFDDSKNIKSEDIYNHIKNFNKYLKNQKYEIKYIDFKKYFNDKKLQKFIEKNDYDDLLIQFDNLDYQNKNELSKKINFDEKYNREIYFELCLLIGYQVDKVTRSVEILTENDIETALTNIKNNINDNFNKLSQNSRDQFLCYKKLEINIFKYQALKKIMGSYIELPKSLQRQGLINIKNEDNYCFIWSYVRYLNPVNKNPNRINKRDKELFNNIYKKLKYFEFPLKINKNNIKKIEDILEVNICILSADKNNNVIPMFSSENNHKNYINLFNYKDHICLIKDLNKYLHRNNRHKNKTYFCSRCLNSYVSEENLKKHKKLCLKYNKKSEKLILPKENSILKFEKIEDMIKTPFTIYYDIETYNHHLKKTKQFKKIENTTHEKLLKPYLIGYILKCNYDEKFSKKCQIFIGDQCIEKMILSLIFTERPYIWETIKLNFNKTIECNPDLTKFDINTCHLCNKKIIDKPVKNHCHFTSKMLGYAHNKCNLRYKFKKDNVNDEYLINVFAHNSQNFDQSFLIRALQNLDNKIPFSCLPRNSNKFISIQIGSFIFKDSYLFLNKSLDYLTKTIDDNDRISLKQEFGKNYQLLTKKGIYPYDYFDNTKKYNEQKLPDKKEFFNKINNKDISDEDYNHAKNVFEKFNCKNLLDYSILYLKTDICHLSDIFQKFSKFAYETYELDPRHSYTLPGFSWQSMLKMTKIELELISDPDMYLFLMDTIRGGIAVCNKKHVIADNKYIDKNTKNNKYLMYLDANNLYGVSMVQSLPYKNFKWSNDLTLDKIQTGIYEVDLEIPKELHDKFKDYPLCPEIKNIPEDNLSEYQNYLNKKLNIKYSEKDKKLILDLLPKKNYKIYYKNLEYYMKLGVKITKIHKILTFDEKPFLKGYIDLNTELRKNSKNDLEKDLFKLMNNAIFGKSMENVLNRSNIKLINNDPEKLLKLIRQPNFQHAYQISNKLCLVESTPIKTVFDKPIYIGACILETSKLHMYQFWYEHLKNKYNVELVYTDTDSLIIQVKTNDIYKDMFENKDKYDFSEYPKDHPNYDISNKKILGKFKDEMKSLIITEFIGLKPKMYSLNYLNKNNIIENKNTHKGIKESISLNHYEYKRSLYKEKLIYKEFYNLQLNKQNIYLDKINKIALNPFESKRYWIDNINSLPYGYVV